MEIIFCKATIADLEAVSLLFDQYRVFYNMPSDLKAANQFVRQRLELQDSHIYLAKNADSVIAFAQIYPSFSSVAMQPIWSINDLYVETAYRRQAVASQLINHIKTQAIRQSIFNLQLATAVDNSQAQSLYAKLGFQKNSGYYHYSLLLEQS